MDERLRFVARLLEGEKMAPVCREFGISRGTGYKIFERYKACGLDRLYDCSKAPYRQASKLPFQGERAILGLGGLTAYLRCARLLHQHPWRGRSHSIRNIPGRP